ncbi:hypothetical protein MN608_09977 [Microdochium nivale]|nr:hypothetical protein MN608_09977 [Microdochium nivale]
MKWYATVPFFCALASAASWPNTVWQNLYYIGGQGGDPFTAVAENGHLVTKMRVYKTTKKDIVIRGVKLFFSDNTDRVIGTEEGDWAEKTFEGAEIVKSMSLWGDGRGRRVGRMKMTTDKGEFDFGKDTKGQQEYPIDVGSGFFLGFDGNAGADIDALAPVFIRGLKQRYFENIKYADFDINSGFELEHIRTSDATFNGVPWTFAFTGSRNIIRSKTFTSSITSGITLGLSFKAQVPLIAETEFKTEWSLSGTAEHSSTDTVNDSIGWTMTVNVTAENSWRCTASFYQGNLDVEWTGDLVLIDNDGYEHRIGTSGSVKSVDASKVISNCEPLKGGASRRGVYELIEGPRPGDATPPPPRPLCSGGSRPPSALPPSPPCEKRHLAHETSARGAKQQQPITGEILVFPAHEKHRWSARDLSSPIIEEAVVLLLNFLNFFSFKFSFWPSFVDFLVLQIVRCIHRQFQHEF